MQSILMYNFFSNIISAVKGISANSKRRNIAILFGMEIILGLLIAGSVILIIKIFFNNY